MGCELLVLNRLIIDFYKPGQSARLVSNRMAASVTRTITVTPDITPLKYTGVVKNNKFTDDLKSLIIKIL